MERIFIVEHEGKRPQWRHTNSTLKYKDKSKEAWHLELDDLSQALYHIREIMAYTRNHAKSITLVERKRINKEDVSDIVYSFWRYRGKWFIDE